MQYIYNRLSDPGDGTTVNSGSDSMPPVQQ